MYLGRWLQLPYFHQINMYYYLAIDFIIICLELAAQYTLNHQREKEKPTKVECSHPKSNLNIYHTKLSKYW